MLKFKSPNNRKSKIVQKDTVSIIETKELALVHQLFFTSNPLENESLNLQNKDAFIYVRVDGTQTVRKSFRLQM